MRIDRTYEISVLEQGVARDLGPAPGDSQNEAAVKQAAATLAQAFMRLQPLTIDDQPTAIQVVLRGSGEPGDRHLIVECYATASAPPEDEWAPTALAADEPSSAEPAAE